jgi:hypothetical protein
LERPVALMTGEEKLGVSDMEENAENKKWRNREIV